MPTVTIAELNARKGQYEALGYFELEDGQITVIPNPEVEDAEIALNNILEEPYHNGGVDYYSDRDPEGFLEYLHLHICGGELAASRLK